MIPTPGIQIKSTGEVPLFEIEFQCHVKMEPTRERISIQQYDRKQRQNSITVHQIYQLHRHIQGNSNRDAIFTMQNKISHSSRLEKMWALIKKIIIIKEKTFLILQGFFLTLDTIPRKSKSRCLR